MRASDFIHPDDAASLERLRNIPALPSVMKKVFELGYDQIMWSENVTTNLRLGPSQVPEVYNLLPPICKQLGIPVPELYLNMNPLPNSWTSGQDRIYIVITLGLVRRCSDEEIKAALAHECGHIICNHVLYNTLAEAIYSFGDTLMESLIGQAINIVIMKGIRQALNAWQRASELSADRVACMVTSAGTLVRTLAKIERIPCFILQNLNFDAWAAQGEDYELLKNGSAWSKIVRYMANSDMDHPYTPVRVYEAMKWEKSKACVMLKNGLKLIANGQICPVCGNPVTQGWQFCKKCGTKLQ